MPNYDFQCSSCGKVQERFAHMDDTTVVCECGAMMTKLFSPPLYKPICDIEPYWDQNLGNDGQPVLVQSRQHKAELLKKNNLKMADSISDYL